MRFDYYNIWTPGSAKVDSTRIDNIKEWENANKTHTKNPQKNIKNPTTLRNR